jgi:hypothetical protein
MGSASYDKLQQSAAAFVDEFVKQF